MGTNTGALHPDNIQRVRDLASFSTKREPCRRGVRNHVRAMRDGKHKGNKALYVYRMGMYVNAWRSIQRACMDL